MNFSAKTKAWLLLICLVGFTTGTVFLTSLAGGCKWYLALIAGLVNAASAVYHALNKPPGNAESEGIPDSSVKPTKS